MPALRGLSWFAVDRTSSSPLPVRTSHAHPEPKRFAPASLNLALKSSKLPKAALIAAAKAPLGSVFPPGDMLSQVIVVSPGLPQYNLERELLKSYYQEIYGHGFGYAYLIPGLTRVVQAAGRLLRSEEDRGVIALLCGRFQDSRYARLLPEEWTDGDPATMVRDDPEAAVREFFARSGTPGRRGG